MRWLVFVVTVAAIGQEAPKPAPIPPAPGPAQVEEVSLKQLAAVRRVFVDRLTGGETAAQMREILLSTLQGTKLFVVTEKEERADAVLRGGAEDLVYTETHSSSDGVNVRGDAGSGRAARRGERTLAWGWGQMKANIRKSAGTRQSRRYGW
jgi:hypothetical protein